MHASLLTKIASFVPVSAALAEEVSCRASHKHCRKGEHLLWAGNRCGALYYLETGLLRHYYPLDGEELTGCFSLPHEFVTATSFFSQTPSRECIIALEDTRLLEIKRQDLIDLYQRHPPLEQFGRLLAERVLLQLEDIYLLLFANLPARERYEQFFDKYPYVLQRVPLGQLASFLRMSQSTLSRIRRSQSKTDVLPSASS